MFIPVKTLLSSINMATDIIGFDGEIGFWFLGFDSDQKYQQLLHVQALIRSLSPHWISVKHLYTVGALLALRLACVWVFFFFSSLIWWFIHLQLNEYAMTLSPNPASHLQLSCQCHSHIKTAFMQQWGLHRRVSVGRIQSSHSFSAVCVSLTSLTISPSSPVYYRAAGLVLFVVSVRRGIKKECGWLWLC